MSKRIIGKGPSGHNTSDEENSGRDKLREILDEHRRNPEHDPAGNTPGDEPQCWDTQTGDEPADDALCEPGEQKRIKVKLSECSQAGVALAMEQLFQGKLAYIKARDAWVIWKGFRWEWSEKAGEENHYVEETLRAIMKEYPAVGFNEKNGKPMEQPEYTFAAKQLAKDGNVREIAKAAKRCSGLRAQVDEFDNQPHLLLCKNGVVDLRNGTLIPEPKAEWKLTAMCPIEYDPDAEEPEVWNEHLRTLFDGDQEMIDVFEEYLGYSISGETTEECLTIIHGPPRSGKGTMLQTVLKLIGPELGGTIKPKSILRRGEKQNIRADLAVIWNKRLLRCSEFEPNDKVGTAVREVTGNDSVTAEFKYGNPFEYRPRYKLIIDTNDLPRIDDPHSFSRLRMFTLHKSFLGEEDRTLKKRMQAPKELQGILLRLVRAAERYYERGRLLITSKMEDAVQSYKDSDVRRRFVNEMCVKDPAARLDSEDGLYAYDEFLQDEGEHPHPGEMLKQAAFGRWFGRQFTRKREKDENGKKRTVYLGVCLNDDGEANVKKQKEKEELMKQNGIYDSAA